jgi:membrane-associated phospholipid phosphatase
MAAARRATRVAAVQRCFYFSLLAGAMHGEPVMNPHVAGAAEEAPVAPQHSLRWQRRVLGAIVLGGAVFALAFPYDPQLLEWQQQLRPRVPESILGQLLSGFRAYGEILNVIAILTLVAIYEPRRRVLTALLLASLLSNGIYSTTKAFVRRERPRSLVNRMEDLSTVRAADTWRRVSRDDFARSVAAEDARAFPSGHSASSFALTGVLAWYYRRAALLFWIMAVGCTLSRYFIAAHWLTDCAAGATLGYLCALVGIAVAEWDAARRAGPPAATEK